jgi:8-oxo-dGTP diphosphatase
MESGKIRPKVGVGVVVIKGGKILLGKRKGAHGSGSWSPAGGHLEFGESLEACAKRELLEGTGLKALSFQLGPWTNDVFEEGKHYITLFVFVHDFEGEPQPMEPEKCESWHWFDWNALPSPLFSPVSSLIKKMGLEQLKNLSFYHDFESTRSLLSELYSFYRERDWEQFHSPKNLVMNLASEIGELVEPFRWLTEQQSYEPKPNDFEQIKEEIGDVFMTLVYLSHKLGIDPVKAAKDKLIKLNKKYPVEQCRGKSLKYTAYETASSEQ